MHSLITRKAKIHFAGANVGPLTEGKTFLTQLQYRNCGHERQDSTFLLFRYS